MDEWFMSHIPWCLCDYIVRGAVTTNCGHSRSFHSHSFYDRHSMKLTPEACQLVVRYANNRADLCSLCTVSRTFQTAAERALYNTLFLVGANATTVTLCNTLTSRPQVAQLVRAMTIHLPPAEAVEPSSTATDELWSHISAALQNTTFLLHLNIHINDDSDTSVAWILQGCTFKLLTFHCDLQWDAHLISFLDGQDTLTDLYISDYVSSPFEPSSSMEVDHTSEDPSTVPQDNLQMQALPSLALLECTFIEAAAFLMPGRAVTHLKTCTSQPDLDGQLAEISTLFENLPIAKPLRSFYLADDYNTWAIGQAILRHITSALRTFRRLRYIGTLVLPVRGRERLMLYGMLMKLPKLQYLELDISTWDPPPATLRAYRALSKELSLYCKSVHCVVYVQDDDRTVLIQKQGAPAWVVDADTNTDTLWRDV